MYVLKTVLTSAATPVVPVDAVVQRPASWQQVTFYNPSAHVMYVGDSRVSSTLGIPLQPSGSFTVSAPLGYTESLNDWWAIGTNADTLLTIVIP